MLGSLLVKQDGSLHSGLALGKIGLCVVCAGLGELGVVFLKSFVLFGRCAISLLSLAVSLGISWTIKVVSAGEPVVAWSISMLATVVERPFIIRLTNCLRVNRRA